MAENKRWRDPGQIHTSFHTYELLLISLQNRRAYSSKEILKLLSKDTEEIAEALSLRCSALLNIPGVRPSSQMSQRDGYTFCIINVREHLDRLEKLVTSSDPVVAAHSRERLDLALKFWNNEWRGLDCAQRIRQLRNRTACFCFGTIDLLDIIPTPTTLWANFFRMKLAENPAVSGLLSYPMHLIKRVKKNAPNPLSQFCQGCSIPPSANLEVIDHNRIVPDKENTPRFMLYTFIHRPPDWGGKKKKEFLRRSVDFLLEARFEDRDSRPRFARKHDELLKDENEVRWRARKELFLTFSSTFPLVLKSEMRSLKDASVYLSILAEEGQAECQVPFSTSSIVGWYDPHLFDANEDLPALPNLGGSPHPERFQLYLKLAETGVGDEPNNTGLHRVVKNVLALLYQVGLIPFPPDQTAAIGRKPENFVIYKRFYFWDYLVIFQTQNISRLVQVLVDEVPRLRGIEHSATIPLWRTECEISLAEPTDDDRVPVESPPDFHADVELRDSWKEQIEVVPQNDNFLCSGPGTENPDLLDNMINWNLEMLSQQYRWLLSYISQMEKNWQSQVLGRRRGEQKRPSTFSWLRKHLVRNHFTLLLYANADTAKIMATLGDPGDPASLKEERLFWSVIKEHREKLDFVKKLIVWIASEYNERTEGSQAVTLTEHFVKAGEQTGVMDIYIDAADRLFRHYCSEPKINERTKSTIWNKRFENYRWRGISSSSSGEELEVIPMYEILFLPVDFKFNIIGRLLPIAHEAAHQVLFWIDPDQDWGLGEELIDSEGGNLGLRSFNQEVWDPLLHDTFRHARSRNADPQQMKAALISAVPASNDRRPTAWDDLIKGSSLEYKYRKQLYEFEFMADVLGLLSAGPALLRGLMFLYRYQPSFPGKEGPAPSRKPPEAASASPLSTSWKVKHAQVHPPTWLRIAYLHLICQRLGWLTDDPFDIQAIVENHFREYEIRKGKNLKSLVLDIGTYQFPEKLDQILEPKEKSLEYYFYTAMKEDPDNTFIYNILRWIQLYGKHSLYYPFPLPDNVGSPEAVAKAQTDFPAVIAWVNHYTAQIGDRLIFNDEVVTDAPLRYIAAASMLSGHNHSSFCMGRIIHSLYYSYVEGDDFMAKVWEGIKPYIT